MWTDPHVVAGIALGFFVAIAISLALGIFASPSAVAANLKGMGEAEGRAKNEGLPIGSSFDSQALKEINAQQRHVLEVECRVAELERLINSKTGGLGALWEETGRLEHKVAEVEKWREECVDKSFEGITTFANESRKLIDQVRTRLDDPLDGLASLWERIGSVDVEAEKRLTAQSRRHVEITNSWSESLAQLRQRVTEFVDAQGRINHQMAEFSGNLPAQLAQVVEEAARVAALVAGVDMVQAKQEERLAKIERDDASKIEAITALGNVADRLKALERLMGNFDATAGYEGLADTPPRSWGLFSRIERLEWEVQGDTAPPFNRKTLDYRFALLENRIKRLAPPKERSKGRHKKPPPAKLGRKTKIMGRR